MHNYREEDVIKYGDYFGDVIEVRGDRLLVYFDELDEERELRSDDCIYMPPVMIEETKMYDFIHCIISFDEFTKGALPKYNIRFKQVKITLEDFVIAFNNINTLDSSIADWASRILFLLDDYYLFDAPSDDESIHHLVNARSLYNEISNVLSVIDGTDGQFDIRELRMLTRRIEDYLVQSSKPILEREYQVEDEEDYVLNHMDHLENATATEKELYKKFVLHLVSINNPQGLFSLGMNSYEGTSVFKQDYVKALECMEKVKGDYENPYPELILGNIYHDALGTEQNFDLSFKYYSIASACGLYEASYRLADMYRLGEGVPKNEYAYSNIINHLYEENLKYVENNETVSRFGEVALRMGDLFNYGLADSRVNKRQAYDFYLQAQFTLLNRMNDIVENEDYKTLETIKKRITEVEEELDLTCDTFNRTRYITGIINDYNFNGRRVEVKVTDTMDGNMTLSFSLVPRGNMAKRNKWFYTDIITGFADFLEEVKVVAEGVNECTIEDGTIIDSIATEGFVFDYGEEKGLISADSFRFDYPITDTMKHQFVKVHFEDVKEPLDFLCNANINIGDFVEVEILDKLMEGQVIKVFEKSFSEMPENKEHYRFANKIELN